MSCDPCKKDDPPAPVDPQIAAAAQTKSNIDTANANANLNRINQITPWGSQIYTEGPLNADGTSQWTQTMKLDPAQQKLLDSSNRVSQSMSDLGEGQLGRVGDSMAQTMNYNGAPAQATGVYAGAMPRNNQLQTGAGYGSIQNDVDMSGVPKLIGGEALDRDLQTQRDSLYRQQTAFLDPQWKQDQSDLENKLVQQGVMQNSDAWNRATGDFGRNKEFAYNNARESSITGGGAEQSRLFGVGLASNQNAYGQALGNANFHNSAQAQGFGQSMANAEMNNKAMGQNFAQGMQQQGQQFNQGLANANLQNQGRTQSINETNFLRQQPLNELNALRTGSQVTAPQFGSTPQTNVAPTDIMSQYNNQFQAGLANYNGQIASGNSNTQGWVGIAMAAAQAY